MTRSENDSDETLVQAALEGSREAFGRLVRKYEARAFATAFSMLGHHADAWDVVQEAFIAAYCKLTQLREPGHFAGWLRSIVRSLCLQHRRRQQRGPTLAGEAALSLDAMGPNPASRHDADRLGGLWDAVEALPQIYREAVLLRYEAGLSYREIADALDLPHSTVKGRLQQGRLKLREALVPEEEMVMAKESVHEKVMEAVCRIAREPIHQEIPLGEAKRVVLYCFVPASIHVTGTEGDVVVLSGARLAVGHTEEEASANLAEIQVLSDQVDDWMRAGPHPGEMFCGTDTGLDGEPTAIVRPVSGRPPKIAYSKKEPLAGLYREMQPRAQDALNDARARMQGGATRISLVWEHMKDIQMSQESHGEVLEAFVANWTDEHQSHGPAGRVELNVGLPSGTELVVTGNALGVDFKAEGLRSDMFVSGAFRTDLRDIEGTVCLHGSGVRSVERIHGTFIVVDYCFGGAGGGHTRRERFPSCRETILRHISGEIQVDIGKRNLKLGSLSGDVHIRNRFGPTHLDLDDHLDSSQYRVESDSGDVVVRMAESLFGQVSVVLHSICGDLDFRDLAELDRAYPANDLQVMTVSTIPLGNLRAALDEGQMPADVYVKTRDGNVTIEKMA